MDKVETEGQEKDTKTLLKHESVAERAREMEVQDVPPVKKNGSMRNILLGVLVVLVIALAAIFAMEYFMSEKAKVENKKDVVAVKPSKGEEEPAVKPPVEVGTDAQKEERLCRETAKKLEKMLGAADGIAQVEKEVERLKAEEPKVYEAAVVQAVIKKWQEKAEVERARVKEIDDRLETLKSLQAQTAWGGDAARIDHAIEEAGKLLLPQDAKQRVTLTQIRADWDQFKREVEAAKADHAALLAKLEEVTKNLKTKVEAEDGLKQEVDSCEVEIAQWWETNKKYGLELADDVKEAEKKLIAAKEMQQQVQKILSQMKESREVEEYLKLRTALLEQFSSYKFVQAIGDYPLSAAAAAALIQGTASEQVACKVNAAKVSDAAFKEFLEKKVLSLAKDPAETDLYGIYYQSKDGVHFGRTIDQASEIYMVAGVDRSLRYIGLSRGAAKIEQKGESTIVNGELYETTDEVGLCSQFHKPRAYPLQSIRMGSAEEMRELIAFASREGVTAESFGKELIRLIGEHLESWKKVERKGVAWYPPIRRVQMIARYMRWLKDDLKMLPVEGKLGPCYDVAFRLAAPVFVEGMPNDLTWACLKKAEVEERNAQCREYLEKLEVNHFIERYWTAYRAHEKLAQCANWKVRFVGSLNCPSGKEWRQAPKKVYSSIFNGVVPLPLYVARREKGKILFKRVLEADDAGGMRVVPSMRKELLAGDPLFQIVDGDEMIDTAKVLKELQASCSGIDLSVCAPYFTNAKDAK